MLEVIILFVLGKKIAQMASDRGRAAWPWVLMLVLCWFGGEVLAAIGTVLVISDGNVPLGDDALFIILGVGYLGAIAGAVITFVVVSALPAVPIEDDDDDYEQPRRQWRREIPPDDRQDWDGGPRAYDDDEETLPRRGRRRMDDQFS